MPRLPQVRQQRRWNVTCRGHRVRPAPQPGAWSPAVKWSCAHSRCSDTSGAVGLREGELVLQGASPGSGEKAVASPSAECGPRRGSQEPPGLGDLSELPAPSPGPSRPGLLADVWKPLARHAATGHRFREPLGRRPGTGFLERKRPLANEGTAHPRPVPTEETEEQGGSFISWPRGSGCGRKLHSHADRPSVAASRRLARPARRHPGPSTWGL